MQSRHAILIAAAVLAAPAFAQYTTSPAPVTSSSGASVSSGTGTTVTPGAPSASVTVQPSSSVTVVPSANAAAMPANTSVAVVPSTSTAVPVVPGNRMLPGAATVQASSTTELGGPAAPGVSGTKTVVTRYWVNVPANVTQRHDFQRWMALKP